MIDTESPVNTAEQTAPSKKPDGRTPEQKASDSRFAAARRKAEHERDEAIASQKRSADRERQETVEELLSAFGAKDPETGVPIRTEAQWRAYRREAAARREAAEVKEILSSEKTAAPEVSAIAEGPGESVKEAEKQAAAAVEAQLQALNALDPNIKSMADLPKMTHFEEFRDNVLHKGLSFADAYNLAHLDERMENARAAGMQSARNELSGKAHLLSREGRQTPSGEIPAEVEALYRRLDPGATRREMDRLYRKTKT